MKNLIKQLLTQGTLITLGLTSPLFGDLATEIGNWLTSGTDIDQVCQNIGKKGRLLSVLPRKTKDTILETCEYELLGIDRKSPAQDLDFEEYTKSGKIHPRAWQAITNIEKYKNLDTNAIEEAAKARRTQLRELRHQKAQQTRSPLEIQNQQMGPIKVNILRAIQTFFGQLNSKSALNEFNKAGEGLKKVLIEELRKYAKMKQSAITTGDIQGWGEYIGTTIDNNIGSIVNPGENGEFQRKCMWILLSPTQYVKGAVPLPADLEDYIVKIFNKSVSVFTRNI